MTDRIRVLVVDDSAFMRKALSRAICADPRFAVIGTACNGQECVQKALDLRPDVITLDVEMPVQGGLETLQYLSSRSPAAVVMVSAATEAGAKITLDALALGAVDFIPKAQGTALLHEKILAAANIRRRQTKSAEEHGLSGTVQAMLPLPKGFSPRAIVIGSSTGGPQALTELLTHLIKPLPVPVFIAQHMPAPFTAALARRLSAGSGHHVVEAHDGDAIVNGTIFIARGGLHMRTSEGVVTLCQDAGDSLYQPSVDVLASSVFESYGKSVLAVMLTGLGRDGSRSFTRLKDAGAWTIAQDGASCTVFGMPKALIEAGGACEVLPLKSIAHRIGDILANKKSNLLGL